MSERRAGGELRVAGRTLTGTAIRYGDISPDFRERFEPGAFGEVRAVDLNLQHDPAVVVVRRATLTDSPQELRVSATLPEGSAALALVRRGSLNGYSIEFHAKRERRDAAGIRVVEAADLTGLALVDRGAYPASQAEVRARGDRGGRLGTVRAAIPTGAILDCSCGPAGCTKALFESGALDNVLDAGQQRDLLGVWNNYSRPLGSRKGGSVRFWNDREGNMQVAVDVPNTPDGEAFMATMRSNVPVVARPYLDAASSTFVQEGAVARYSRAHVRSINIGSTDLSEGWAPLVFGKLGEGPPPAARRRVWL